MKTWPSKSAIYPVRALMAVTVAVVLTWNASQVRAQTFTHVVSFGDSLSDTGNIFEVTSDPFNAILLAFLFPELDTPFPPPPYFDGRFSNGPVWVERLSDQLGLGPVVPSELGGLNYAVGGATTFDDGNFLINLVVPDDVEDQVDAYLNIHTPAGGELFIVEGGSNDLLSGGITDVSIPAGNLEGFITDLYNAGGRNFLVPNLPPLGQIPGEVGGPDEMVLDMRSAQFNLELSNRLDNLDQNLAGIMIHRVDFYAGVQAVLQDPNAFGFTNVTEQAFDPDTNLVVPNPNQYLFWDNIHPTAPAHLLLGDLAADVILAPAACDFNVDNTCGLADINLMFDQGNLVTGAATAAATDKFDLIDDNVIDNQDIAEWLSQAATENSYGTPYQRGDTDGLNSVSPATRDVDLADYLALSGNFDPSGASGPYYWEHGNFDGDDDVDLNDYLALSGNFAPGGYGAEAVPEPAGLLLGLWAVLVLLSRRSLG